MNNLVDINLEDDITPKRRLRSTLKCYLMNPATNPVQLLAPLNHSRYKVLIVANDQQVIITTDNPTIFPSLTVAGIAPENSSVLIPVSGNGFNGYEHFGPDPLWAVAISGNANSRLNIVQTFWENAELSSND